jgi:hypothetical protein
MTNKTFRHARVEGHPLVLVFKSLQIDSRLRGNDDQAIHLVFILHFIYSPQNTLIQ